ncbi:MAG: endonuclease/exonuclease/phosphatase family protein [Bacteroidetes bacterium]|nr:endonuclease/exonuclease/phosphatase family protein [Bacteroidota bacterium]
MGIINKILLFFNYLFAIALLISWIARYINPSFFWPVAFFGLAYSFLALINIAFVLLWLLRLKFHFLISLLSLLAGWQTLRSTFPVNVRYIMPGRENVRIGGDSGSVTTNLEILSYNVRLFDLYNWKNNENKRTRNKIFDLLKSLNPDILCLQEFYQDDKREFVTLDSLVRFLDARNYHVEYTKTLRNVHRWGIITLSRFPVAGKGKIVFGKGNNICIFTDIVAGTDTVRIYNMHLASVHFSRKDYSLMEEITDLDYDSPNYLQQPNDTLVSDFKRIFSKLKKSFIMRGEQVERVAEHIGKSPYPVIICGDINDTPSSYAYHTLRGDLADAWSELGLGLGYTYADFLPVFRIDYIFHSPSLRACSFEIIPEILSDHRAVLCEIEVGK